MDFLKKQNKNVYLSKMFYLCLKPKWWTLAAERYSTNSSIRCNVQVSCSFVFFAPSKRLYTPAGETCICFSILFFFFFLQGSKVQVKVEYWISFISIYLYINILYDYYFWLTGIRSIIWRCVLNIYIHKIINKLLYVNLYHWSVFFSRGVCYTRSKCCLT